MINTQENTNNKDAISEIAGIRQQLLDLEQSLLHNHPDTKVSTNPMNGGSPAAFIVQNGLIKTVNKRMMEISGYPEHELIGISPLTFVLSEDRTLLEKLLANANSIGSMLVHEFRILTKSASIKWVIAEISLVHINGSQTIIANLIDITAHMKTEESKKAISERYHDICENIDDMILCVTPAGQTIYANRAWSEQTGYQNENIANLSIFEILPKDYREHYRELIQRAISGECDNRIETIFIDSSGKRIPVEGSINCRFVGGKPDYLRIVLHDISKRKQEMAEAEAMLMEAQELNRKLKESNSELEEFTHIASHDLQEPLRKISSFGDLLKDSLKDQLSADDNENFDFMIDGAKRMQIMINDLLAYSRITSKAKPFKSVDPNKVINDLTNIELASMLEKTKGSIIIPQPLPVVYGDSTLIYQLFQNLILNGLKFQRDGIKPSVSVTSSRVQNSRIQFCIQDNGIGIDPEYYQQIFTMFKRLHSREEYQGTGIGLAICKKIIQRHGGEIWVKSKEGDGSTFLFTLLGSSNTERDNKGDRSNDE